MGLKSGFVPKLSFERLHKTSGFKEPRNVMHEDLLRQVPIREIVPFCLFSDASFQGTFHGVTREIVRAVEPSALKKYLGVFQPRLGKPLQFSSIHCSLCKL